MKLSFWQALKSSLRNCTQYFVLDAVSDADTLSIGAITSCTNHVIMQANVQADCRQQGRCLQTKKHFCTAT